MTLTAEKLPMYTFLRSRLNRFLSRFNVGKPPKCPYKVKGCTVLHRCLDCYDDYSR